MEEMTSLLEQILLFKKRQIFRKPLVGLSTSETKILRKYYKDFDIFEAKSSCILEDLAYNCFKWLALLLNTSQSSFFCDFFLKSWHFMIANLHRKACGRFSVFEKNI